MLSSIPAMIMQSETANYIGRIENIIGMSMEASGGGANIGDIVLIYNEEQKKQIPAEVVGFKDDKVQLMAYEDMKGIGTNSFVRNTKKRLKIPVGEFLRGRIIDAMGHPMDGKGDFQSGRYYYVENPKINPMERPPIRERLSFGIKAIDGLNTVGKGQRIGIFAGSGVGKSTLMGMKCPMVATTIAEYFKDQGKDVLLMMDSLTRFAMAQREIGLATGEPPVARGYTPSIYAEFPRLLERSGNFEKGSITGVYTVLVEGDDTNEPVADTVRGILDGHIVLSRKLANANHFPAIDVNASISRLMTEIVTPEQRAQASQLRDILSLYEQNEDLISIGAYKAGTNPKLDYAISKNDQVQNFLMQGIEEKFDENETWNQLEQILK